VIYKRRGVSVVRAHVPSWPYLCGIQGVEGVRRWSTLHLGGIRRDDRGGFNSDWSHGGVDGRRVEVDAIAPYIPGDALERPLQGLHLITLFLQPHPARTFVGRILRTLSQTRAFILVLACCNRARLDSNRPCRVVVSVSGSRLGRFLIILHLMLRLCALTCDADYVLRLLHEGRADKTRFPYVNGIQWAGRQIGEVEGAA
jgi:hypothetical protein